MSFLLSGESKSGIVKALLGSDLGTIQYPAGRITPISGKLTWFTRKMP